MCVCVVRSAPVRRQNSVIYKNKNSKWKHLKKFHLFIFRQHLINFFQAHATLILHLESLIHNAGGLLVCGFLKFIKNFQLNSKHKIEKIIKKN